MFYGGEFGNRPNGRRGAKATSTLTAFLQVVRDVRSCSCPFHVLKGGGKGVYIYGVVIGRGYPLGLVCPQGPCSVHPGPYPAWVMDMISLEQHGGALGKHAWIILRALGPTGDHMG